MTRFKRECKSALSTVLTVMMVLSMLMGVFSLSASADGEQVYPEIQNTPIMLYTDNREAGLTTEGNWSQGLIYDELMYDSVWDNLSTISIRIDDSNSAHKVADITNVTYTYQDSELDLEFTQRARYTSVNRFGLLLVAADVNNKVSYIVDGAYSNRSYSFFNEQNYKPDFSCYKKYIESLERCEIFVTVHYADGDEQQIPIMVMNEKDAVPILAAVGTAGTILIRLAHSTTIENQDFFALDNAIFAMENANNDTTNKYYVDIDSEEDLTIPLDGLSEQVELVQTRIGDNVVFNNERSVSFGSKETLIKSSAEVAPSDF